MLPWIENDNSYHHHPFLIPTRPISTFVHRLQQEEMEWKTNDTNNNDNTSKKDVYVVGAGAAGIELAMALRQRWGDNDNVSITLVDSNSMLVPNETSWCRSQLMNQLKRLQVSICHNTKVIERSNSHTLILQSSTIILLRKKKYRVMYVYGLRVLQLIPWHLKH